MPLWADRIGRALRERAVHAMVLSWPLWWALGLAMFIWPLIAAPMLYACARKGAVAVPRRFGVWLLFLAWMLASAAELQSAQRGAAFAWRASIYLSATVVFLYVYNSLRARLTVSSVAGALAAFWLVVLVAGWLGVLFPQVAFSTPVEALLPASVKHNVYVYAHVHDQLSQVQRFTGYAHGRPSALFAYTNGWGATFAITFPFAICSALTTRRRRWRRTLLAAFALSIVPVVWSLDRGLWLSLGVGMAYAGARRLSRRQLGQAVGVLAVVGLAVAVIALAPPLHKLVSDRFTHKTGDAGRLARDQQAQSRVGASPLLGYGAPLPSLVDRNLSNVGTESQVFLVLFSHGVPGLFLFLTWFAYTLFRSARLRSPEAFWAHICVLVACIQLGFYEITERLPVLMLAFAIVYHELWREERARSLTPASPAGPGSPGS